MDVRGAGVSRSGFHAWLNRPLGDRAIQDARLVAAIGRSFQASDRTYGARRVWRDVLEEGLSCGLHRIERLVRQSAMRARPKRRGTPNDGGERTAETPPLKAKRFPSLWRTPKRGLTPKTKPRRRLAPSGIEDLTAESYATDPAAASVTCANVSRLAEKMRREKSPAARIGWACAALLSMEREHCRQLVRWIAPSFLPSLRPAAPWSLQTRINQMLCEAEPGQIGAGFDPMIADELFLVDIEEGIAAALEAEMGDSAGGMAEQLIERLADRYGLDVQFGGIAAEMAT